MLKMSNSCGVVQCVAARQMSWGHQASVFSCHGQERCLLSWPDSGHGKCGIPGGKYVTNFLHISYMCHTCENLKKSVQYKYACSQWWQIWSVLSVSSSISSWSSQHSDHESNGWTVCTEGGGFTQSKLSMWGASTSNASKLYFQVSFLSVIDTQTRHKLIGSCSKFVVCFCAPKLSQWVQIVCSSLSDELNHKFPTSFLSFCLQFVWISNWISWAQFRRAGDVGMVFFSWTCSQVWEWWTRAHDSGTEGSLPERNWSKVWKQPQHHIQQPC